MLEGNTSELRWDAQRLMVHVAKHGVQSFALRDQNCVEPRASHDHMTAHLEHMHIKRRTETRNASFEDGTVVNLVATAA